MNKQLELGLETPEQNSQPRTNYDATQDITEILTIHENIEKELEQAIKFNQTFDISKFKETENTIKLLFSIIEKKYQNQNISISFVFMWRPFELTFKNWELIIIQDPNVKYVKSWKQFVSTFYKWRASEYHNWAKKIISFYKNKNKPSK